MVYHGRPIRRLRQTTHSAQHSTFKTFKPPNVQTSKHCGLQRLLHCIPIPINVHVIHISDFGLHVLCLTIQLYLVSCLRPPFCPHAHIFLRATRQPHLRPYSDSQPAAASVALVKVVDHSLFEAVSNARREIAFNVESGDLALDDAAQPGVYLLLLRTSIYIYTTSHIIDAYRRVKESGFYPHCRAILLMKAERNRSCTHNHLFDRPLLLSPLCFPLAVAVTDSKGTSKRCSHPRSEDIVSSSSLRGCYTILCLRGLTKEHSVVVGVHWSACKAV
jgi:hypothetical protein